MTTATNSTVTPEAVDILVREIAAELGYDIIKRYEHNDNAFVIQHKKSGACVHVGISNIYRSRNEPAKIVFSSANSFFPRDVMGKQSEIPYQGGVDSISCSMSRGARAIAKDYQKRYEPDYLALWAKLAEQADSRSKRYRAATLLADEVERLLVNVHTTRNLDERMGRWDITAFSNKTDYRSIAEFNISIYTDTPAVEVKLCYLRDKSALANIVKAIETISINEDN